MVSPHRRRLRRSTSPLRISTFRGGSMKRRIPGMKRNLASIAWATKKANERRGCVEPRGIAGGSSSTDDGSGGDRSDPVERREFGEGAALHEAEQDRSREEQRQGFDGGIDGTGRVTDQGMKYSVHACLRFSGESSIFAARAAPRSGGTRSTGIAVDRADSQLAAQPLGHGGHGNPLSIDLIHLRSVVPRRHSSEGSTCCRIRRWRRPRSRRAGRAVRAP